MRITFHGGASEVGRNCISLDDEYLFDAGLKISEEGSEYPQVTDVGKIRAVFLAHAHLDHSGALPLFSRMGMRGAVFCTQMTKDTAKILLKDSLHVELLNRHKAGYSKEDIIRVVSSMQNTAYDREYSTGSLKFKMLYAGHIPGSASVYAEYKGKTILYTSDINTSGSRLLDGASFNVKADVMICESTYGDRNHPPRQDVEKEFLDTVQKAIDSGGSALIPAFSVGRAQEMLLLLHSRRFKAPVYLDGMAKEVTNAYLHRPDFLKDPGALEGALKRTRLIRRPQERREVAYSPAIIVTTSGMLDGGPVIDYLRVLYHQEKSCVLLTGYQTEESNGRLLLDTGRAYVDGLRIKVRGTVKKFDFSAHAGQKELVELIRRTSPKHLMLIHGDRPALETLAGFFRGQMDVHIPVIGETITI
jgi:putative mRNA 3-end processing factor